MAVFKRDKEMICHLPLTTAHIFFFGNKVPCLLTIHHMYQHVYHKSLPVLRRQFLLATERCDIIEKQAISRVLLVESLLTVRHKSDTKGTPKKENIKKRVREFRKKKSLMSCHGFVIKSAFNKKKTTCFHHQTNNIMATAKRFVIYFFCKGLQLLYSLWDIILFVL